MNESWIYLSHKWGPSCPTYGNGPRIEVKQNRCISSGDTCNSISFTAQNHIGSHFDFPKHFDRNGAKCDDYAPEFFVHQRIALFWLDLNPGEIIEPSMLIAQADKCDPSSTLALLRTGASSYRNSEYYWKNGPAVGTGVADLLRKKFVNLTTFGIDSISISSFSSRELGRVVHREFLCDSVRPILLIEDLCLEHLNGNAPIECVSLPLRIEDADGAPCTVIAKVGQK